MMDALYNAFLQAPAGVCIDTRKIERGTIFFAIKGPNFNANTFAQQALDAGAAFAVIDEPAFNTDSRCILVENVLETLQALARHHRRQLKIPVLAITGSNGKTTTKELCREVLSKKYKTLATLGNLNNHIGVPLTLLSIKKDTEFAIIEMGANAQKEIAMLCNIAEPDYGLVTNMGRAHTEGFGGIEGVIKGKSELYDYLVAHDGMAFVNTLDELLVRQSEPVLRKFTYPAVEDNFTCTFLEAKPFVTFSTLSSGLVSSMLIGEYNFANIAAALAVGHFFDVNDFEAIKAISTYIPANNRSQLMEIGEAKYILDAYNANPDSMAAALRNFEGMQSQHKIVVLGDMNELGSDTAAAHRQLGESIAQLNFETVFLFGKHMHYAAEVLPEAQYFDNFEALKVAFDALELSGKLVLLKGSRTLGLERLLANKKNTN